MAAEVPQTLEYRGGQLNAPLVLELEGQWTVDERKAANLDQRLKSLIISVVPDYLNDLEEEHQARALLAKFKRFFKKGTQRYKALMNELVNDGIKLSKLEINTSFIRVTKEVAKFLPKSSDKHK
ncbi:hypothetical protein Tco_1004015 [Tanacetum coccineum]|uniref:Uncharacterized protein n=1 Tax=Tanacetum coccineum TaxID=301880 RepID=A0ABQ5FB74_9ASTR